MQKIFITGATGFIGQALLNIIDPLEYEVHILIRQTRTDTIIKKEIHQHHYTDCPDSLTAILNKVKPNTVIHLAAYTSPVNNMQEIERLYQSNLLFSTQLLEAMRQCSVQNLITIDSFYQHHKNKPYKPVNLYAATKEAFKAIIEFYRTQYNIKILTLTLGQVYGKGEPSYKVLSQLILKIKTSQPIDMSPGLQWLPLIHVNDVARGILMGLCFLNKQADGSQHSYTLAPSESYQLKQIVAIIEEALALSLPANWGALPYRENSFMEPWQPGPSCPIWKPEIDFKKGLYDMLGLNEI